MSIISILMACTLSHLDVPAALAAKQHPTGLCTGSYRQKADNAVIGAWSMSVVFVKDETWPQGIKVVRVRGGLAVPDMESDRVAMTELEQETLKFIGKKVKEAADKRIDLGAEPIGI